MLTEISLLLRHEAYRTLNIILIACFVLSPKLYGQNNTTTIWVEESFEDFHDGTFDAAGRNLYVTKKGTIKTINRFDFNSDGYIDFPVNSSHNVFYNTPATFLHLSKKGDKRHIEELPVEGSIDAVVADLNMDQHVDIVILPNANGVSLRRYLTILWGTEAGWVNERKTGLITIDAVTVQVADLNQDKWPEIIVLNGTRWSPLDGPEAVARIYWGSEHGYMHHNASDIVVDRAVDMQVKDMDQNGLIDLVFLLNGPGQIMIYWNNGGQSLTGNKETELYCQKNTTTVDLKVDHAGRLLIYDLNKDNKLDLFASGGTSQKVRNNPTTNKGSNKYSDILYIITEDLHDQKYKLNKLSISAATNFGLDDLDQDGNTDIVIVDSEKEDESLCIFWGAGDNNFDSAAPTVINLPFISSIATADINGDNFNDIIAGISRTKETFQGNSFILIGKGRREFTLSDIRIPTSEVGEIVLAQGTDDLSNRIVFCNGRTGRLNEDVPIGIYWGGPDGFDTTLFSTYTMRSAYCSYGADLNDDGYPDMIQLSIVHATKEYHPEIGFNLFWGDSTGLEDSRRKVVNEFAVRGLEVTDINYDGFLDIVSTKEISPNGDPEGLAIWHGGETGFLRENREFIPLSGRPIQNVSADYNKDGYMDIAIALQENHKVIVLWGSENGFSSENSTSWPIPHPSDINTADLNNDSMLDLLVTSHKLSPSLYFDYGTYIFWGSPDGFNATNAQRLLGDDGIGITVADWDQDGYLDVFLPAYHFGNTRESVAAHLFWNSDSGFHDTNRTDFMQDGGHDALAADFNHDGLMDLLVANHTKNGSHFTESQVFYNDGRRFKKPEIQFLPTVGPHYIHRTDIGHIYNRTYQEEYISSIHFFKKGKDRGIVKFIADIPEGGSELFFSIRLSKDKPSLETSKWIPLNNENEYKFQVDPGDQYIQYRCIFQSDNGDRYPSLDKVTIELMN